MQSTECCTYPGASAKKRVRPPDWLLQNRVRTVQARSKYHLQTNQPSSSVGTVMGAGEVPYTWTEGKYPHKENAKVWDAEKFQLGPGQTINASFCEKNTWYHNGRPLQVAAKLL